MNRKLKTLGLIFFAVFAVGATTASSAQAFVIKVEKKGAKITSSSEGKMNFGFGLLNSVKCADTEESAEIGETELGEEILTPTFKECLFGGQPIAVDDNGCNYDYKPGTVDFIGTVGIQCPANTKVEVTLTGCTVTVPPQAGLKSVTFKNINPKMGAKQEVTLEINVAGLTFELDPVGGTPTCKKEQRTNGTMTGSETETAELGGVMVGVWVE